MTEITKPYDLAVMDTIYRVIREEDGTSARICIYSDGQLRFSLPEGTSGEEVEKFVQVYALGVSDGRRGSLASAAERVRGQLQLAARRLGSTAGQWKAGAK